MGGNRAGGENRKNDQCCCGPRAKDNIKYRSVPAIDRITTEAGDIDVISTRWTFSDYAGMVKVRLDIDRMNYAVAPGIYAVGKPDRLSPVLVSANYKLSFDELRRQLGGLNIWILVIDTKGVNVWCAAGKETFSTLEICNRIGLTRLEKIVDTRKLIVPQLGAPGVSCRMVQAFSGFSVIYGPVRASDIKKYLASGMKADAGMRRVRFGFVDRLTVSWLELAMALKPLLIVTLASAV
ncbi:MAG: mercury methylation corrinoid protein HgcA, partial [Candidatus Omnitrophota bacterium]